MPSGSQIDAILGNGQYARRGAPEPSLLPVLTRFAPRASLGSAADQAEFYSTDYETKVPIPAIGRATARVVASRAARMDNQSLYQAALRLPVIGRLTSLAIAPDATGELAAHIGVRLGDDKIVKEAVASTSDIDESIRARAAGLPLVGTTRKVLDSALAELSSVSVYALGSLAAHLDTSSTERLLNAWLDSGRWGGTIVAGVVEILPALGKKGRERATDAVVGFVSEGALRLPPEWRIAYLVRRLRETLRGASAPELDALAADMEVPWNSVVARLGPLDHLDDEAALLDSHPYGKVVADGPLLQSEVDEAIRQMAGYWIPPRTALGDSYRSADNGMRSDELYLNARVTEIHGDLEIPRTDGFARGQTHRVSVHLATEELANGIVADLPVPIDRSLTHELYISFFASWLRPTAPVPIMVLAGAETTEAASVEFRAPDLHEVRLAVLIQERYGKELVPIQSGVLNGAIVDPGAVGPGISLRIDPHPIRPAEPGTEGVTIALADDTLAVYDGSFREPGQLREMRANLGNQVLGLWSTVEKAARKDEDDKGALAWSLVELAARGNAVLELLKKRLDADKGTRRRLFETDMPVRLWSRDLDTDLPIEFIYDRDVRELNHRNPALCPQFFGALRDSACKHCDRQGALCAFDFWAFRRRIERRVADDRDAQSNAIAALAVTSKLPALTAPAVFGASQNVSTHNRKEMVALLNAGGASIEKPVADWTEWQMELGDRPHRLLVLLSHTEQAHALEIESDLIDRQFITERYVNPQRARPGPIVLLTGCETAQPEYSFLSFVSKFLDEGAAVVVGTLALIREDVSAEATKQLVQSLREVIAEDTALEHRTVGEVMRRTRCRLLADRNLTGFNLVAYGDADWRFESVGAT